MYKENSEIKSARESTELNLHRYVTIGTLSFRLRCFDIIVV